VCPAFWQNGRSQILKKVFEVRSKSEEVYVIRCNLISERDLCNLRGEGKESRNFLECPLWKKVGKFYFILLLSDCEADRGDAKMPQLIIFSAEKN
jgi:hypothetical protein